MADITFLQGDISKAVLTLKQGFESENYDLLGIQKLAFLYYDLD